MSDSDRDNGILFVKDACGHFYEPKFIQLKAT